MEEDEYDEILNFYTNKDPVKWTTVERMSTRNRSTLRLQNQDNEKEGENDPTSEL